MTAPDVLFHLQDISFNLEKVDSWKSWILDSIKEQGRKAGTINFIFCSDDYLLKINRQYLQHDYYTDVITFQHGKYLVEGDIFVSIDRVRDNAKQLEIDPSSELLRVLIHGVLHLMGFSDKEESEKQEMSDQENFFLNRYQLHFSGKFG